MTKTKRSTEEHTLKMIPDFPDCKHNSGFSINSHCRSANLWVRKRKGVEKLEITRKIEMRHLEPVKKKNKTWADGLKKVKKINRSEPQEKGGKLCPYW